MLQNLYGLGWCVGLGRLINISLFFLKMYKIKSVQTKIVKNCGHINKAQFYLTVQLIVIIISLTFRLFETFYGYVSFSDYETL